MNILITGHTGFIGSHLTKILGEHNIIGVDIKDGHNIFEVDYLEPLFSRNEIDTVIHLAALAGVGYSMEHSEDVLNNNIIGFDRLAKTAIRHGVRHFIYASSSLVYGGKSLYAVTKQTNELQAAVYANMYDMKFTGLRFFTVYGNGMRKDQAISRFVEAMRNDTPINVYGDGTIARDFVYIDDICEAVKRIVESDKEWHNEVFDIGYGESVSINRLILVLKDILNPTFYKVMYGQEKGYDVKTQLADPSRLYDMFGFRPRYDIIQGLKEWLL